MKSLLFTFLTLFNVCLVAQTIDPNKFFPSSVGNVWEYSYSNGINRFEIVSDSLLEDSSKYFYYAPNTDPVYRIDTNYNVFWIPTDSGLNWHYYKLDVDSGDHWMVRPETAEIQRMEALVRVKYPAIFLGRSTTIMEITYYDLNWGDTVINQYAWPRFTMTIGYGIGEIMQFDKEGGGPYKILQGCIIYGDTIGVITSVKVDPFTVKSFDLFQNYPNPFNPTTKISWQSPVAGHQTLNIYDVLGNEVATLVDEYRNAGKYEVNFDAARLASGIYFYRIITPNYTEVKKMILIK
jgi:hypothetical protein